MDLSITKHSMNNVELDNNILIRRSSPSSPDLIQLSDSDCAGGTKTGNGYQIMISEDVEEFLPDHHSSGCISNGNSQSPSVSSPASESPTPTNSTHEKTWTTQDPQWQTLVNDEHRQLLGTEDDSSDRHSSDEDPVQEDLWAITSEQEEYYWHQFVTMQPDTAALLAGNKAKEFFEKSKLPIEELIKIWQLADVTEDGALSLQEFCVAMHLVVLRRNNIGIPDVLPTSLHPKSFINPVVSGSHRPSIAKISNINKSFSLDSNSLSDDHKSLQSGRNIDKHESGLSEEHVISPKKSKEWAKFSESPTATLSSPGPKPCNFDFLKAAVAKDPKILHPKPLRLTPESNLQERIDDNSGSSSQIMESRSNCQFNSSFSSCASLKSRTERTDSSTSFSVGGAKSISPVTSYDSKDVLDKSLYGPTSLSVTLGHVSSKMELPPPPPPRSYRNHVRSSSLDLNKIQKLPVGPPVPPRISPNMGSPQRVSGGHHNEEDVSNRLSDVSEDPAVNLPNTSEERNRHSAFEIYKKPQSDDSSFNSAKINQQDDISQVNQQANSNFRTQDKREILSSLRTLKEKNIVLSRVNSELNQELAEVIEERISLQYQLEQMKPFSH